MKKILILLLFISGTLFAGETNPFDKVSEKEKEDIKNTTEEERLYEIQEIMILSFNYGFGYMAVMTGSNISVDDVNFADDLASGNTFEIALHRYYENNLGFGLVFSYYYSNASIKVMNENNQISMLTDKVKIPSLNVAGGFKRADSAKRIMYGADVRIGGAIYQEELSVFNCSINYKCPTVIFGANLFVEYLLNKSTGIGLSCTGTLGSISELYVKGGSNFKLEKPLSLNRIDILLSLKFHFGCD